MDTKSDFLSFKNDRLKEFNHSKEFIPDLYCNCKYHVNLQNIALYRSRIRSIIFSINPFIKNAQGVLL
jgi:hypothetical protein